MPDRREASGGSGFLAVSLLLCGVGAAWLLLSPTAFERRARRRQAERLLARNRIEWRYNVALERRRHGLLGDPSAIEKEARELGYGRPGERRYPLTPQEIHAEEVRLVPDGRPRRLLLRLAGEVGYALVPALMLILAGAVAVMFFSDLRIADPGIHSGPEQHGDQ